MLRQKIYIIELYKLWEYPWERPIPRWAFLVLIWQTFTVKKEISQRPRFGKFQKCSHILQELYQKALEIIEISLGPEHEEVANVLANMGKAQKKLAQYGIFRYFIDLKKDMKKPLIYLRERSK